MLFQSQGKWKQPEPYVAPRVDENNKSANNKKTVLIQNLLKEIETKISQTWLFETEKKNLIHIAKGLVSETVEMPDSKVLKNTTPGTQEEKIERLTELSKLIDRGLYAPWKIEYSVSEASDNKKGTFEPSDFLNTLVNARIIDFIHFKLEYSGGFFKDMVEKNAIQYYPYETLIESGDKEHLGKSTVAKFELSVLVPAEKGTSKQSFFFYAIPSSFSGSKYATEDMIIVMSFIDIYTDFCKKLNLKPGGTALNSQTRYDGFVLWKDGEAYRIAFLEIKNNKMTQATDPLEIVIPKSK